MNKVVHHRVELRVERILLEARFACKVSVVWRRGLKEARTLPVELVKGQAEVSQTLALQLNFKAHGVQSFAPKRTTLLVMIHTSSGIKIAGIAKLDPAQLIQLGRADLSLKVERCPDKEARVLAVLRSDLLFQNGSDALGCESGPSDTEDQPMRLHRRKQQESSPIARLVFEQARQQSELVSTNLEQQLLVARSENASKIALLSEEIRGLRAKCAQKDNFTKTLQSKFRKLQSERNQFYQRLKRLNSGEQSRSAQLSRLNQDLATQVKRLEVRDNLYREQLRRLAEANSGLANQVRSVESTFTTQLQNLRSCNKEEVQSLTKAKEALGRRVAQLIESNKKWQELVQGHQLKVKRLETLILSQNQEKRTFQLERQKLVSVIQKLREEVDDIQKEHQCISKQLQQRIEAAEERNAFARSKLLQFVDQLNKVLLFESSEDLDTTLQLIIARAGQLVEERDSLGQRIVRLENEKIEEAFSLLSAANFKEEELNQQLQRSRAKIDQLQQKVSVLSSATDQFERELVNCEEINQRLREQYSGLQQAYNSLQESKTQADRRYAESSMELLESKESQERIVHALSSELQYTKETLGRQRAQRVAERFSAERDIQTLKASLSQLEEQKFDWNSGLLELSSTQLHKSRGQQGQPLTNTLQSELAWQTQANSRLRSKIASLEGELCQLQLQLFSLNSARNHQCQSQQTRETQCFVPL